MVAIQGLGGIPEPKPEQPSKIRKDRETAGAGGVLGSGGGEGGGDDVMISSEALAAAKVTRLISASGAEADVRADKVAAARERLESGAYKDRAAVAKTAEKLLKYLS